MKIIQSSTDGTNYSIAIIASKWNNDIMDPLKKQTLSELKNLKINEDNLTLVEVSGTVEVLRIAKKLANSAQYNSIICLGALINVSEKSSLLIKEITLLSINSKIPIINGIISAETQEEGLRILNEFSYGSIMAQTSIEMMSIEEKL
jgi:6,7-dimethyl-8-ribityllumazine synthase